ncbi:uncharacterized protein ACRADG_006036 [Cochliomyia hominivorax]
MANKVQKNNENIQNLQLNKNGDTSRKHLLKKQAFGEIKNVIHNQENGTPLKHEVHASKSQSLKYLGSNIVGIIPSKNIPKSIKKKCVKDIVFDEISLDYFDFRGKCCSKHEKSIQDIWSEMNMYDDSFINKIIDENQIREEESIINFQDNIIVNDAELNDLEKTNNYTYWPDINALNSESDFIFL